jgi:hypothetical protein
MSQIEIVTMSVDIKGLWGSGKGFDSWVKMAQLTYFSHSTVAPTAPIARG